MAKNKKISLSFASKEVQKATVKIAGVEEFAFEYRVPTGAERVSCGVSVQNKETGEAIVNLVSKCLTGWQLEEPVNKVSVDALIDFDDDLVSEIFKVIIASGDKAKN